MPLRSIYVGGQELVLLETSLGGAVIEPSSIFRECDARQGFSLSVRNDTIVRVNYGDLHGNDEFGQALCVSSSHSRHCRRAFDNVTNRSQISCCFVSAFQSCRRIELTHSHLGLTQLKSQTSSGLVPESRLLSSSTNFSLSKFFVTCISDSASGVLNQKPRICSS